MLYRLIARPLLYLLPAETAHDLVIGLLQVLRRMPPLLWLLKLIFRTPKAPVECMGLRFANPIGLAAGFDKDARCIDALAALGFGFVEVGTFTAKPQTGNPQPRLFRLPADRALINRMGFNNQGAADAARRLQRRRTNVMVGANIGKSKATPEVAAADDYAYSARLVAPHVDYLVLNVSSPNTPGLRNLQAVSKLEPIVCAVQTAVEQVKPSGLPILIKIAPDLNNEDIDAVAEMVNRLGLAGIIATNTTIRREHLRTAHARVEKVGAGGLSGPILKTRSLEVLVRLRAQLPPQTVLISVGGIENSEDVWLRLQAGANLVQVYTALVYQGPGLVSRVMRKLAPRLMSATT